MAKQTKSKGKKLTIPRNLNKSYLYNFITDIAQQAYDTHSFLYGVLDANKKVFEKNEKLAEIALGIDDTLKDLVETIKENIEDIKNLPNMVNKKNSGIFAITELTLQTLALTLNSVSGNVIPDLITQTLEECSKDPSLKLELSKDQKEELNNLIAAVNEENDKHVKLVSNNLNFTEGDKNGK